MSSQPAAQGRPEEASTQKSSRCDHDHAPLVELLGMEVEETKSWERVVSLRLPVSAWDDARAKALVGVRRKAQLPGFRKGKVPAKMVAAQFAQEIAYEALDWLLPRAWHQAMHDLDLAVVNDPEYSDIDFGEGKEVFFFKATVQVRPVVSISGHKGIKVTWYKEPEPEGGVDQTLSQIRESRAEFTELERAAAAGDRLTVDFQQVDDDGLFVIGTEVKGHVFELGSEYVLAAFSEGLRGASPGEERQFPVTYPADYDQESLAGQIRRFKVTLQKLEEKNLPALDDDFAAEVGEFKSLAELQERIAKNIKAEIDQRNGNRLETALVQSLLAINEFEMPPVMVSNYVEHLIADQEQRGGRELEPAERTEAAERMKPAAEFALKRWMLLDAVAEQEAMLVSDEEFEQHLQALAEAEGGEIDSIRRSVERAGAASRIREDLLHRKVFEFLREQAKIKEEAIPQPAERS